MEISKLLKGVKAFEAESAKILGSSDGAIGARAFNAREALVEVGDLSLEQGDSLKQAVRCVEHDLFRAACVMAWTAVADLILSLAVKEVDAVKSKRAKWEFEDKTSLSETYGDYAIISALKESKVITKSHMKSLHGLLHRRNQCAHPSDYFPTADEALGYIREAISFCRVLHERISK